MAYVMSENEKRIVSEITIPDYYNQIIVPTRHSQGRTDFREISDKRASGICPFHDDTDPSLHYWSNNNMFKCFGCGKAGSVVQMHMYWMADRGQKIDKETAIKQLGQLFGVELVYDETGELKTESVFELARKKFQNEQYRENIYDQTKLTLGGFRTFNNQLKNRVSASPYITGEQAANLYYRLDLTLSAYLADVKEGKS